MTLHIITVANKNKYYFDYLKESIEKNNGKLTVLGCGMEYKGFIWIFKLMKEYLLKLNKDNIVCLIDGFDVLCINDTNNIINIFNYIKQRENCKIITGYDFHPNKLRGITSSLYYSNSINTLVINAGTIIGRVDDVLHMFNEINLNNIDDDTSNQYFVNQYYKNHKSDIYIDINAELFLTIVSPLQDLTKYITIKNNTIYYKNNKPYFIHAAGSGYLDNVIKELGYELKKEISCDIKKNYIDKKQITVKRIIHFIYRNKYYILFYIICILYYLYFYNLWYVQFKSSIFTFKLSRPVLFAD